MITIDGDRIRLRPFADADANYIKATWLRSALRTARTDDDGRSFFRWARPMIEHAYDTSLVRVACFEDEPDAIVAWAAMRGGAPVYAYTAAPHNEKSKGVNFRHRGLMRALTEETP